MTININDEIVKKNGLKISECLLLLLYQNNVELYPTELSLVFDGYITANKDETTPNIKWRLTNKGIQILNTIILDSDKHQESPDRLTTLATSLKELFPKGKKPGTNYYWADGIALIIRRLKLFFKKYGNTYSDAQIIQATKKYIEGFNGNYQYMRLLKYFIFKEKVGAGGDVEGDSELISYVENAGQEDALNNNWTTELK